MAGKRHGPKQIIEQLGAAGLNCWNGRSLAACLEARVPRKDWKQSYNTARPHSALGYLTPAEFASSCLRADSAKPRPARGHDGDG